MRETVIQRLKNFTRDPNRPCADDRLLVNLLIDVLAKVDADRIIHDETLAVLYGIATELIDRVRDTLPAPIHCTAAGHPVWSEQQVADALGITVEEVRARLEMLEAEGSASRVTGETHMLN